MTETPTRLKWRSAKIFIGNHVKGLMLIATTVLFLLQPASVSALSFVSFDARSMAMGGIGVASARGYNASLFNPALLSGWSHEKSTTDIFLRPYVGARLIDRDNFIDSFQDYQDNQNEQALKQIRQDINLKLATETLTTDDLRSLTRAGNALLSDIENLSH